MENCLENQVNLNEVYNELGYDELTNVLNEWLNPENKEGGEEETVETTETKKTLKETTTVDDASSAFDELFNR